MASYIIAGRADDPSFARAEYAAKQIEAACPNVFFRYEMKHPDAWKEFIQSVFRQFDFHGFSEDFAGPLVWTHEGELVGSGAEFVQKIVIEKFGIRDPPSMSDPMFRQIAADNLKQVRLQLQREQSGPPFAEKCEVACARAQAAGLLAPQRFASRRRVVVLGVSLEVWISATLNEERAALREAYGAGQPATVDPRLEVANAGQENSHVVLVHPQPLCRRQLVLVPRRVAKRPAEPSPEDAGEEAVPAAIEVPQHGYREDAVHEDLSLLDFAACMEVMQGVPGVAAWLGLREGAEYRHPLDTHLQVLPFPLHSQGEGCPLRYPMELLCDAGVRDGVNTLKVFPFHHVFSAIAAPEGTPEDKKKSPKVLGQVALDCYEAAKLAFGRHGSYMLAFTTSWMVFMPLVPPAVGTAPHEAWLQMPPPPACALCGVVVAPTVAECYPETARMAVGATCGAMVSTRAVEEGIPEGTPEYEAASREVRISRKILDDVAALIGVWAA